MNFEYNSHFMVIINVFPNNASVYLTAHTTTVRNIFFGRVGPRSDLSAFGPCTVERGRPNHGEIFSTLFFFGSRYSCHVLDIWICRMWRWVSRKSVTNVTTRETTTRSNHLHANKKNRIVFFFWFRPKQKTVSTKEKTNAVRCCSE